MGTRWKSFTIENGLSRGALFDACQYAAVAYTGDPESPRSAFIELPTRKYEIHTIKHDDGSGTQFKIYGSLEACWSGTVIETESPFADDGFRLCRFSGFYDTKGRKGWLNLERV